MDLKEACDQAFVILNEEQVRPTISYRYLAKAWPEELLFESDLKKQYEGTFMAGVLALDRMRKKDGPRPVKENPTHWKFESRNFELIKTIYSDVPYKQRELFLSGLLKVKTIEYVSPLSSNKPYFPNWDGHISALPLIVEVCIRTGHFDLIIEALNEVELPNANLIVMFMQLQELLALNFNQFSLVDLRSMKKLLHPIYQVAEQQTWQNRRKFSGAPIETNPRYIEGFRTTGARLMSEIDKFLKQCDQAIYFYVASHIERAQNPEISADGKKVEEYLARLGFNQLMVDTLREAERLYRNSASSFDLKNCLGLLRSFLEQLHIQACSLIAPVSSDPTKWGAATSMLRLQGFISPKDEAFITSLYTLVSDEAIHPLIAPAEYARLFRNIVIEYGLLFLSTLEKKGVKAFASAVQ